VTLEDGQSVPEGGSSERIRAACDFADTDPRNLDTKDTERRRLENRTPITKKQGQYIAFIHNYTKINGRPPAEADMQRYFLVTPPPVHQMILTLEQKGLLSRVPGKPRSICLLLPKDQIPQLE
jgi:repressor LexA